MGGSHASNSEANPFITVCASGMELKYLTFVYLFFFILFHFILFFFISFYSFSFHSIPFYFIQFHIHLFSRSQVNCHNDKKKNQVIIITLL